MKYVKDLWANRTDSKGRIDITIFFINVFLLLVHVFFMFLYIYVKSTVMIYLNIGSIILYSFYFFNCVRYASTYPGIVMLEIWIHMLFAMLTFGWQTSFQNWTYAMLIAVFLPIYNKDGRTNHKVAFIFSFILIFSYFLFSVLIHTLNYPYRVDIPFALTKIFFLCNNLIVFFSIIMITLFYTLSTRRKTIELSRKADFDELTNLYNRHSIKTVGSSIIFNAKTCKKNYGLAIIDIDFFKKVNDVHGHISGDLVLKELSNIIRMYSFKDIKPGRWGGEEFIIICPHTTRYDDFTNLLELLRVKVEKTLFTLEDGKKIHITISIGAANVDSKLTLEEAVSIADENLYKAKTSGRNKLIK